MARLLFCVGLFRCMDCVSSFDRLPVRRYWTHGVSESTYLSLTQAIYEAVGPLTALGLKSSYQNEGSIWESDWQEGKRIAACYSRQTTGLNTIISSQAFFDYKYDRLLEIKRKYDPGNCMFARFSFSSFCTLMIVFVRSLYYLQGLDHTFHILSTKADVFIRVSGLRRVQQCMHAIRHSKPDSSFPRWHFFSIANHHNKDDSLTSYVFSCIAVQYDCFFFFVGVLPPHCLSIHGVSVTGRLL